MMKKIFNKILIQPKIVLSIFLLTSLIVISFGFIEYSQSKKEINSLMQEQSHTLLESIMISSKNAIKSYNQIKDEINERLLNNAILIKHLYENGNLKNSDLKKISEENNLFRVIVFSNKGKRILTSHSPSQFENSFQNKSKDILKEIFSGEEDTLLIGIREPQSKDAFRYVVAVATKNHDAIVVNIDAKKLIELRNELGFGPLLREFVRHDNIKYVAFQNENGVIAAAGTIDGLDDISSSDFLTNSYKNNIFSSRIFSNGNEEFYESVHPVTIDNNKIGLLRLGLSIEPLKNINDEIIKRTIIMSLILLLFGIVTFSFLFAKQNFDQLSIKFRAIENYFKSIFDNVGDAIIIVNNENKIETVNNSALQVFESKDFYEIQNKYKSLFAELMNSLFNITEKEITVNNKNKSLIISKSIFIDENKNQKVIFVIRDITNQKLIERQQIRNKQLTALGELSSSVAHEIRNPLNAIATITQQIGKDFSVKENENDFKQLTSLVYHEVKRINEIIENFLKFARPLPLKPEYFSLKEFFLQLESQYKNILGEKNIKLNLKDASNLEVVWDRVQMKQVFINLFENSIDAIKENGNINIEISTSNDFIEISFSDSGCGIPKEVLDKIFNIYFTTKAKGNGIGLSIVQKIVSEHNGLIFVSSEVGKGTTFKLILPKVVEV